MASESANSESPTPKRPRRSKPDPPVVRETPAPKRSSIKLEPLEPVEFNDNQAALYEPGDIVWCKLGSFPWWPALVYKCAVEGGIHTKLLNTNNKPKRVFFVYFYGKYLEYSWISTKWLLKYAGLSNFIQHAETAVQKASTKSEQHELANRYQLKVSMKKRVQWDEAIELADRALAITNNERIQEFTDLLQEAVETKPLLKNARRRKSSLDTSEQNTNNEEQATASVGETTSVTPISHRKPAIFNQNGSTPQSNDDESTKNKRSRKSKSVQKDNEQRVAATTPTISEKATKRVRTTRPNETSQEKSPTKSARSSRRSDMTNGKEVEYEYPPSTSVDSSTLVRLMPATVPPLSPFEQKQIAEALLQHPKGNALTLDDAQTFAIDKALAIVAANHNFRMTNVAPEWFYDSILLRFPSVVFRFRSWFCHVQTEKVPDGIDLIQLKQWQVALMLHAQIKTEQAAMARTTTINGS